MQETCLNELDVNTEFEALMANASKIMQKNSITLTKNKRKSPKKRIFPDG
jgi:hypothetical protein